jgi:hypothetical protein
MEIPTRIAATLIACAILADVTASTARMTASPGAAPTETATNVSPLYGLELPVGYRHWELVSVSYEAPFDEFRGIVANPTAMAAYRAGALPFPDGSVIVKLAWKRVASNEFDGAFVTGAATTVQVMLKDSKKFEASGGWGFGRFIKEIPTDEAQHRTCFGCHQANVKDHDFVFTRLAP